jgi:hypothetical protein
MQQSRWAGRKPFAVKQPYHPQVKPMSGNAKLGVFLTMVKKRHSGQYPSLFEFDPDPALGPENRIANATEGDQHAVQNHSPGTSEGKDGVVRTTASDAPSFCRRWKPWATELKASHETWKQTLAEAKPGSEPSQIASEAMEMALKELEDRYPRVSSGRGGTALAGQGNGVRPKSYLERLRASRTRSQPFRCPTRIYPTDTRAPPEPPPAARNPPQSAPKQHIQSHFRQRRERQGTRHPRGHPHAEGIEKEQRPATSEEKQTLARFCGFGPVALSIFPDPSPANTRTPAGRPWRGTGTLLTPAEYDSAKRTTFNAFYTSPTVITAIHEAIARLGVPADATILEPGCGTGNFMSYGRPGARFIGIEMDSISGRIAKAIHPDQDIRIENFPRHATAGGPHRRGGRQRAVRRPEARLSGQKLSLHDYFFAKSIDALKPGGVMALVTTHFTLDKQNAAIREYLASKADFVGAIRLPSDAFKREGTAVVTDILFLRKRSPGEPANHVDADWLGVAPFHRRHGHSINRYFLNHPEMVLGNWTRKDTLYGGEGYSVTGNGDLAGQLKDAIQRLPQFAPRQASPSILDDPG